MSIVVGTDFSEHSRQAVDAACVLALKLREPLRLVHVAQPVLPEKLDAQERSAIKDRLSSEAERVRREKHASVETDILSGVPDEAIVAYAERAQARMVVASALGWRSDQRWRLGSVAERIAETAGCPYVTVRAAAPFEAWGKDRRRLKLAVGDDFSTAGESAVRWAREVRQAGGVDVVALHVYWPLAEYSRLGLYRPNEGHPEIEAAVQRDLRERLEGLGLAEATVRVAPSFGRAADPLVELAIKETADLLVLGHRPRARGHVWHGTVSHTAMHLAPMSVCTVPAMDALEKPSDAPLHRVRKVLVSTDFSALANRAIPHAYAPIPEGGEVTLIHVIQTSIPIMYSDYWPASALSSAAPTPDDEDALRHHLRALVPKDAARRGIETKVEVVHGIDVAQSICQESERHAVDLVCLSTHGRTGITRFVLGSVAQAVISRCRRPVMVVRTQSRT
jgi:nucleotide-binding universal stress UspA family protein